MPLPRAGKLLRTVNGKPHATEADHISSDAANAAPLPTPPDSGARQSRSKRNSSHAQPQQPPAAEVVNIDDDEQEKDLKDDSEDYLRDPVSSDEEEDMASKKGNAAGSSSGFVTKKSTVLEETASVAPTAQFQKKTSSILDGAADNVKKPGFQPPPITSASITTAKRVVDDAELDEESDGDLYSAAFTNSSQSKRKRPKTTGNIHVAPRPNVFGSSQQEKNDQRRKAKERARQRKEKKEKKALEDAPVAAATFKRHTLPSFQAGGTTAGATDGVSNADDCSSPMSSLSPSPEPDSMSIVCETCQERVDKLLKEEYNDYYVKGRSWNIQWQERFCEWHRAQSAKETWRERGYPRIDWKGLESRMQQHNDHLLSVLRNQKKSRYREEYAAKVKAKSMSGGFKDATVKPGATVGYYGPKGEKAMSEHILSGLSDEIRQRAKSDKLVSPSGYQGGISGFVQGVLVPHLAELLIKEDMQLEGRDWAVRVREIITESAEVGELVNPEDRSRKVEGHDDWVLQ